MSYPWVPYSTGAMERAGDEMVIPSGKYVYMSELRELSAFRPARLPSIPESVGVVTTPLQLRAWEVELKGHPDGKYVRFILDGIGQGFRIGYDYSSHSCVSSARNMKSATEHPEPIDRYIREEVSSGRIIGPLSVGGEKIHVSRFWGHSETPPTGKVAIDHGPLLPSRSER